MIEVNDLKKRYGDRAALKGISFSIKEGEIYGLLGPNGAGKTTTISIMSTLLEQDGGEVKIAAKSVSNDKRGIKQIIGVVPQEIALYDTLSGYDNLFFWGSLYTIPKAELRQRIDRLLVLLGLSDRGKDKITTYSGGMKRRINIAAALLHRPKILFMDEPTVGIDPQSRNLIFEVIEQLHNEGMTIVYTTHYLEEAERLCDRIGIIDHGQIVAQGTLTELKRTKGNREAIVVTLEEVPEKAYEELTKFWPEIDLIASSVYFYSERVMTDLVVITEKCNHLKLKVLKIEIQETNLESIFLSLTGKQLRD